MNMGGGLKSPDAYQEIIPLISDLTNAIDDLLQKASLSLVLGMSYIKIRVSFRGIGTNKIVNRKERSRRVCAPIYPDAVVTVNRFLGASHKNSEISQRIYELHCSVWQDDTTLHGWENLYARLAKVFGISKESKDQFSQTCHARLTARPTTFFGISFTEAEPNDIADDKGRQT